MRTCGNPEPAPPDTALVPTQRDLATLVCSDFRWGVDGRLTRDEEAGKGRGSEALLTRMPANCDNGQQAYVHSR